MRRTGVAVMMCLALGFAPSGRADGPGVDAYVVFGQGSQSVKVLPSGQVNGAGLTGGNGKVTLLPWATAGTVRAGGDVSLGKKTQSGDIEAGGLVYKHKTAKTGQVTELSEVGTLTLPHVDAEPGDLHIYRSWADKKKGPLELAPGAYGEVVTANYDHLILHSGTYDFARLVLRRGSQLTILIEGGQPAVLRSGNGVVLNRDVVMMVKGGDAGHVFVATDSDVVRLGRNGVFLGTFLAGAGKVQVDQGAQLAGAAWGNTVLIGKGAQLTWMPFVGVVGPGDCQANADCDDANPHLLAFNVNAGVRGAFGVVDAVFTGFLIGRFDRRVAAVFTCLDFQGGVGIELDAASRVFNAVHVKEQRSWITVTTSDGKEHQHPCAGARSAPQDKPPEFNNHYPY